MERGGKAVVFCRSTRHLGRLQTMLGEFEEIPVQRVDYTMTPDQRNAAKAAYEHGSGQQILLGINLLGLGWDSSQTNVGIFPTPRIRPGRLIQEFGRLLRWQPGKRSLAIQLYDTFTTRQPVLLPQILDPDFVFRQRVALRQFERRRPE